MPCYLIRLSNELLAEIASYLSPRDLRVVIKLNKKVYYAIRHLLYRSLHEQLHFQVNLIPLARTLMENPDFGSHVRYMRLGPAFVVETLNTAKQALLKTAVESMGIPPWQKLTATLREGTKRRVSRDLLVACLLIYTPNIICLKISKDIDYGTKPSLEWLDVMRWSVTRPGRMHSFAHLRFLRMDMKHSISIHQLGPVLALPSLLDLKAKGIRIRTREEEEATRLARREFPRGTCPIERLQLSSLSVTGEMADILFGSFIALKKLKVERLCTLREWDEAGIRTLTYPGLVRCLHQSKATLEALCIFSGHEDHFMHRNLQGCLGDMLHSFPNLERVEVPLKAMIDVSGLDVDDAVKLVDDLDVLWPLKLKIFTLDACGLPDEHKDRYCRRLVEFIENLSARRPKPFPSFEEFRIRGFDEGILGLRETESDEDELGVWGNPEDSSSEAESWSEEWEDIEEEDDDDDDDDEEEDEKQDEDGKYEKYEKKVEDEEEWDESEEEDPFPDIPGVSIFSNRWGVQNVSRLFGR
ncbi:unnamed protein product [Periconia digitata]|uniref:F-box domain-containing protein n=1 Tax=Periconia digitata TaxID=1303443 RepID=A0A9W4XVF2_9PLEO|nr:unnamed protein product [Periconia digitata]